MSGCPLCNCLNIDGYLNFNGNVYQQCKQCSLVFLDKCDLLGKDLYTGDYLMRRGLDNPNIIKAKEAMASYYLSLLGRYSNKKKLLEIGCSTGITLNVARKMGWNVHGVEVNDAAVFMAKKNYNIQTIKTGNLSSDMFEDEYFSDIVMFDVLEHILSPVPFMEILKRKLQHLGCLLIVMPNINSLSSKLLNSRWPHLFPDHVCLYSPKSIRFLLEMNQFKILKISWAIKFVTVDMIKRHLECHPHIFLSRLGRLLLSGLPLLNDFIFPFNLGEMYILAQRK